MQSSFSPSLFAIAALACLGQLGCAPKASSDNPTAVASNGNDPTAASLQALITKTKRDLIFVQGGVFQMGDFGTIHSEEKLPYTSQPESKPLHTVEIDSYSLGRYKVTYEDFDVYTQINKMPKIGTARFDAEYRATPNVPAGVNWPEAKAYCQWLGKVTALPFGLPTEAQWEFAARNRGKFVLWATDNGLYEEGKNVASYEQYHQWMPTVRQMSVFVHPVGKFAPSPLGFYDMGTNGSDWLDDWFNVDYYEKSPRGNPRGPATGNEKSKRGLDGDANDTALTMYRQKGKFAAKPPHFDEEGKVLYSDRWPNDGFRCAVNSTSQVNR